MKQQVAEIEQEYETVLIVKIKGHGLLEHKIKQAERVLRELELAFHAKGTDKVKVFWASPPVPLSKEMIGKPAYVEQERVVRMDRNARD